MGAAMITKITGLFLSIIAGVLCYPCSIDVKLNHELIENSGFHRNMTYSIAFLSDNQNWLYKDCIVGLEQVFPPGIFTNPDELLGYRQSHKLRAIPKNKINVELSTEQAHTSTVYMVGKVANDHIDLWLPVHARYHQAVSGGGMATNVVDPPKLYFRCPDHRLSACDNQMVTSQSFLCNGSTKEKCTWSELPFNLISKTLKWEIPVGNTDHYYIVAIGTSAAVILGSLYLLKVIHDFQVRKKEKNC